MRALILTPDRNSGTKKDYTGAFKPEAHAFAKLHGIETARIGAVDVSKPAAAMRLDVEARLSANGKLDVVAFFCHGFRNGIQLGYRMPQVKQLARAIAGNSLPTVRVVLYACSTGASIGTGTQGDGGFADALRDALCAAGATQCQVDSHDTAAHATRNPRVRRFLGQGSTVGGTGGGWLVAPGSPLWGAWVKALRNTDLRLRFPMMSVAEIHAELASPTGAVA